MRSHRLRTFFVMSIVILAALAASVSGVLAHDPQRRSPKPPAASGFIVTGNVQHRLRLSVADLAAMDNQESVDVTYHAAGGAEHHVFTGPLLLDVLARAVPLFDPAVKNDNLRYYVSVTATDAYQAQVVVLDRGIEQRDRSGEIG